MFINFLSRIVNIFNIMIVLKIKKILLLIQGYYYYYYNNIPNMVMMLCSFIRILIVIIEFLYDNPYCSIFINNLLDYYIIEVSYSDIVLNINDTESESSKYVTNSFPKGLYTEAEFNRMQFEDHQIRFLPVKKNPPDGPPFRYEKSAYVFIYPEKYHTLAKHGEMFNNNTLRVYNENPFKYHYYPVIFNDDDSLNNI